MMDSFESFECEYEEHEGEMTFSFSQPDQNNIKLELDVKMEDDDEDNSDMDADPLRYEMQETAAQRILNQMSKDSQTKTKDKKNNQMKTKDKKSGQTKNKKNSQTKIKVTQTKKRPTKAKSKRRGSSDEDETEGEEKTKRKKKDEVEVDDNEKKKEALKSARALKRQLKEDDEKRRKEEYAKLAGRLSKFIKKEPKVEVPVLESSASAHNTSLSSDVDSEDDEMQVPTKRMFAPFQLKKNMAVADCLRRPKLSVEEEFYLDMCMNEASELTKEESERKRDELWEMFKMNMKRNPRRSGRTLVPHTTEEFEMEDVVILLPNEDQMMTGKKYKFFRFQADSLWVEKVNPLYRVNGRLPFVPQPQFGEQGNFGTPQITKVESLERSFEMDDDDSDSDSDCDPKEKKEADRFKRTVSRTITKMPSRRVFRGKNEWLALDKAGMPKNLRKILKEMFE